MPAGYAHVSFGDKVLKKLNKQENLNDFEILKIINKHTDIFKIGLQGPDILFFYKPYVKNDIKTLGENIHSSPASNFFNHSKNIIKMLDNKDLALAYIFGVICHFALDSECHSYIEYRMHKTNVSHLEIETAFDQLLLRLDKIDYKTHNSVEYITFNKEQAWTIGHIFNLDANIIKKSLNSMKFCGQCFTSNGDKKNIGMQTLLKLSGNFNRYEGLLTYKPHDESCQETCRKLYYMYAGAVPIAINLMNNFYDVYTKNGELFKRFDRTFGSYDENIKKYELLFFNT